MTQDILNLLLQLRHTRTPHALATVVEVLGSSSAKISAKAVIDPVGHVLAGWVGGGCAKSMVAEMALQCLQTGDSQMIDIDLNDEVFGAGMPCGGQMRVFVEPILPKPRLWLTGHGRIVEALCHFALQMELDVIINDAQAHLDRLPSACHLITDDLRYQQLQPDVGDFVVIASHHKGDYEALIRCLASRVAYIGMIASRKRASLILNRLSRQGYSAEDLSRICTPAGLDLGAKLPEEIALAVMAEIVALRRGGHGGFLQDKNIGLEKTAVDRSD